MLLLMFRVGGEPYAVDAGRVHEVVPRVALRAVPHAPAALAGLFEFRGRVVPVVDLGRLLGAESCRTRLSTRIIVVETAGGLLGLVAEHVSDVRTVAPEQVTEAPTALGRVPYLGAIVRDVEGLVHLIEVDRVAAAMLQEALVPPEEEAPP